MNNRTEKGSRQRRVLSILLTLCLLLTMVPPVKAASDEGNEIVGQLKILARYNDSMQFYDGHVYLLFTSYKDGVEIRIDDLYRGYEISDQYYQEMAADIANGSNHTGSDADRLFTLRDDMKSVTLNRGQVVTIGMYRGFDLTVPQAALGSIMNSTLVTAAAGSEDAMKTSVVLAFFGYLKNDRLTLDNLPAFEMLADLQAKGVDINLLLDGTVEGGVCFNRELYNQKLEYDQYENVTFALDITQAQLDRMQRALQGNLNRFSILKNSCATVALRGWNAAVGIDENGQKTGYYLEPSGEGIFAYIDAPKTVKDELSRLPGSWLNNASGVQEPGAGYQDDTGWVYVSGPKKLEGEILAAGAAAGPDLLTGESTETEGPVGRFTISARGSREGELVAHGMITFIPYHDIDLEVSYYDYYKPTQDYIRLMEDYEDHPENYPADPVYYSEELDLGYREAYFEQKHNGAYSAPEVIHLNAGEGITISNYGYEENNLYTVMKAIKNGRIMENPAAQALVGQMQIYADGGEIDGPLAFDCLVAVICQMVQEGMAGRSNPADGDSGGGMVINKEVFNQFRRNDNQLPNYFYTVELTEEELAAFRACLADPGNNYYGLFSRNCASGVVDIWNTTLSGRPGLHISSNFTKVTIEPESLYFELGILSKLTEEFSGTGEGSGEDWTPRIAPAYRRDLQVTPPQALPLVYTGNRQELLTAGSAEHGTMYYALGENADTVPAEELYSTSIPAGTDAGTYYVWYKAVGDMKYRDTEPACVTVSIGKKTAAVTAKAQTVRAGRNIETGVDQAVLTEAADGHALMAVTLTAEDSAITPSAARIEDADGKDVTANYEILYTAGELQIGSAVQFTVTFKVLNGAWDDGSTEDAAVVLSGMAGDALKLTTEQIPAAGSRPDTGFMAGSWDRVPDTDASIPGDVTYTYIYARKGTAFVAAVPVARTLRHDGSMQELVSAGEAVNGEMQYALGGADGPTEEFSTSIPAAADAGIYYVWYKAAGNDTCMDSVPQKLIVVIQDASPEGINAPQSQDLVYNGQEQEAVTAGSSEYGKILYAISTDPDAVPSDEEYSETIPTVKDAGVYYVFYKTVENENP